MSTLFKATVLGILLGEIWAFSRIFSSPFYSYIQANGAQVSALVLSAVALASLGGYLYLRNVKADFLRIARSRRFDVLAMVFLGLAISASFGGIGASQYEAAVDSLTATQALLILLVPVGMGLLLIAKGLLQTNYRPSTPPPFFISDVEQVSAKNDLLGLAEEAERFAERVLNGGAPDSIVFGIDAPWGIGKSSFVNFCIEYWEHKRRSAAIVYKFNLLRFEDASHLLEQFVDGLIRTIQRQVFVPEIQPVISSYSRFIRGKAGLSQFGINLEPGNYTVDDAFDDLGSVVGLIPKKIIIVIDDLDRVSFSTIKSVLFAIKKSFTLPNVSYVLCYDTENIVGDKAIDRDSGKVREFLEKFVNVKVSLFLQAETLAKYINENLERALRNNLQLDPTTVSRIKEAVSGIIDIYNSEEYVRYQELLGDVRKLKRLLNTLVMFEIEKTDFANSDFDKGDLINLLLLYINFPATFRKIYSTETGGRRGFFSLVTRYDSDYPEDEGESGRDRQFSEGHYRNSRKYVEYIKGLDGPRKMLLERLFSATIRLGDTTVGTVSEVTRNSLACFNGDFTGGGSRNLERYLNLIVRLSKPERRDQYRFYVNAKDKLLGGTPVHTVLSAPEFSFDDGGTSRQQFWRIVVNSSDEFQGDLGDRLIDYLVDHVHEYSVLEHEKLGARLRDDIVLHVLKLLDSVGWRDAGGKHYENTGENVVEIAKRILGEGRYTGRGIVEILIEPKRGVLGLFDLMLFRLYCCADRGTSIFNVQRALTWHANPSSPTTGDTRVIVKEEMRELSQRIFRDFETQYILPRRNLFELIDALTLEAFAGRYTDYVARSVAAGRISTIELNGTIERARTRLKAFITYQLANTLVSSGIGCGYYDRTGTQDQKGIAVAMNDYLFGICFEPGDENQGYKYFLDYLLIGFESTFGRSSGGDHIPTIEGFTKVLNRKRLAEYWTKHQNAIRAMKLNHTDKTVYSANYIATYREDLQSVYDVLDQLVAAGN